MSDCLFCQIVNKKIPSEIVYEDDFALAFNDINPKADTHILLIPKQHIVSLKDAQATPEVVGRLMAYLPDLAQKLGLKTGFRTIINTEKGGGQEVFHLHLHLLGGNSLPGF